MVRIILIILVALIQAACATYEKPELDASKWYRISTTINNKFKIIYALPPNSKISEGCNESIKIEENIKQYKFCSPYLGAMPSAYGHIIFFGYWYGTNAVSEHDAIFHINNLKWYFKKGLSESNTPYATAYTNLGNGKQIIVNAFSTREIELKIIEQLVKNGCQSVKINAL